MKTELHKFTADIQNEVYTSEIRVISGDTSGVFRITLDFSKHPISGYHNTATSEAISDNAHEFSGELNAFAHAAFETARTATRDYLTLLLSLSPENVTH